MTEAFTYQDAAAEVAANPTRPLVLTERGPTLAAACVCAQGPREFTRGLCHRCGLLINPAAEQGNAVEALVMFDEAIETWRPTVREWAERDGVDPGDPVAYGAWLEAKDKMAMAAGQLVGIPAELLRVDRQ